MADFTTTQHLLSVAKALNNSDVAARNRALDPRGLGSPSPIFKTLILSLVAFSQTVCQPLLIPTCCAGRSTPETVERSVGSVSSPRTCPGEALLWSLWFYVTVTVFHSCRGNAELATLVLAGSVFACPTEV